MLDLNSSRWSDLTHAYGSAADIPDLLRQLDTAPAQKDYKSEPWFSIWSALCHQGDVYTATYAAMPHIIASAGKKKDRERLDCLSFVGYAEACRHREGAPPVPSDLKDDYLVAMKSAREMFLSSLQENPSEEETKMLLGGIAAVTGYPKLGDVIINLDSTLTCLECEADLSSGKF